MSGNEGNASNAEQMLNDLFGACDIAREAVITAFPADEQQHVRMLVEVRRDFEALLSELISDLGRSSGELRENYTDQYRRRTAIRSLAAAVEGIVFELKKLA